MEALGRAPLLSWEYVHLLVRGSSAERQTRRQGSEVGGRRSPGRFPDEILPDVIEHLEPLEHYAGAGRDRRVSLDPQGGQLRVITFRDDWIKACHGADIAAGIHFGDLRHTGNNVVAATAGTRELMTHMGHSTARAALIYQHMTGTGIVRSLICWGR
ncbi:MULTISPECIES: integrase [Streptomyces]|uniref:Integrase n=1 Tax=Streptomyces clavifer TaxID=68188 RepID=A0ABS4VAF7_9ACTN|nr:MULTISPECIES: integrase [Streptomyces]MBP2360791.1 hypothetical protein [Streptomyces clavifer]MDX2746035.1 integrase [Streptomyces sp. NRRL_B-2557]GHB12110.1 hypothetical protein GCM10010392_44750 [Streptomyces clavifer]